jgi:hypothetical protein
MSSIYKLQVRIEQVVRRNGCNRWLSTVPRSAVFVSIVSFGLVNNFVGLVQNEDLNFTVIKRLSYRLAISIHPITTLLEN